MTNEQMVEFYKKMKSLSAQDQTRVLNFVKFLQLKREIKKTAGVSGGAACLGGTRIAVWMLEAAQRQGLNDEKILALYPAIDSADLAGAWNYVRLNEAEIEREIAENEAA